MRTMGDGREGSDIVKIGLAAIRAGRLLVVRKRGTETFILPGGKPEPGESDEAALSREVMEELGCGVRDARRLSSFHAAAANEPGRTVTVVLFSGALEGEPEPREEIEEMAWLEPGAAHPPVAASIRDGILPWLRDAGML